MTDFLAHAQLALGRRFAFAGIVRIPVHGRAVFSSVSTGRISAPILLRGAIYLAYVRVAAGQLASR
jgi:hypothetical protein